MKFTVMVRIDAVVCKTFDDCETIEEVRETIDAFQRKFYGGKELSAHDIARVDDAEIDELDGTLIYVDGVDDVFFDADDVADYLREQGIKESEDDESDVDEADNDTVNTVDDTPISTDITPPKAPITRTHKPRRNHKSFAAKVKSAFKKITRTF